MYFNFQQQGKVPASNKLPQSSSTSANKTGQCAPTSQKQRPAMFPPGMPPATTILLLTLCWFFKNNRNEFATTYLHRIHNNYAFGDVFNQHYQDCNQGCPCQQKFIRFNTHSHSPPFAAKATAQNATGGENVPFCMPIFPTIVKPRFQRFQRKEKN